MKQHRNTSKLTAKHVDSLRGRDKDYRVWDTQIKGFYVRVSPRSVKTYRYYYRLPGKQVDAPLGRHGSITADLARDLAKGAAAQAAKGNDIVEDRKKTAERVKRERTAMLGVFLKEEYQPWAETHLKGHKEAMRVLNTDFKHLHSQRMSDINRLVAQRWAVNASKGIGYKRPLSDASINRRLADLKRVMSKAVEWGALGSSPLAGMKRKKIDSQGRVRFLDDSEEKAFRNALDARQERQRQERISYNQWRNARDMEPLPRLSAPFSDHLKPMAILALNTGLRRGELFSLEWSKVQLSKRILTVGGATAKSSDTRHIPLNQEAFSTLVAWRNQTIGSGLVFPSPNTGKRFDNIARSWANLMTLAKLSDFRFHDLRHHFASRLVMAGVPLNTVRELLGHSSLEMTLKYAHLAPEHAAAAVAVLDK